MDGTMRSVGGRLELRYERGIAHSPEKVWCAITEPEHLRKWFPAEIEGEREVGANIRFVFRDEDEEEPLEGEILVFDPPRLFEYTWGGELLRWELRSDGDGCLLVFTHTFDGRDHAADNAAGWHICLEDLDAALDGRESVNTKERTAKMRERYAATFA